jgi:probable F420-dependent oxidoreductase
VFLEDYVLYQGDPAIPTCPTWPVLAAVAVRTTRLVLGVEVTPLARRRPWNVAREVAAVDQLSEGRVVVGVGLGDVKDHVVADASFTHFGEERDPRQRAELLDEALEIVAGLWAGQPFSFRGTHFTVDEVTFLPRPVQQPRPPIWIGGNSDRALRRAVEHADGWTPFRAPPERIRDALKRARDEFGLDGPLAVAVPIRRGVYTPDDGALDIDGIKRQIDELTDAGATHLRVGFHGPTVADYVRDLETFARAFIA